MDRRFLLLQGPSSLFFSNLGEALQDRGAKVLRVGFCPGERLYWRRSAGTYHAYRGSMDKFGKWLASLVADHRISDILMLGEGRAPHAAAIEAKSRLGLDCAIWIIEHGYLRPDLILIEPEGMGGSSQIPRFYKPDITFGESRPDLRWKPSFFRYAALDVGYHLANICLAPFFYPHYRAHSGISPLREYAGWLKKAVRLRGRRRTLATVQAKIARHEGPVFLFPLQLSQDFQLKLYGTGEDQLAILHRVIGSFQKFAPTDCLLVVKAHPLDNGLTDWAGAIAERADQERIVFLDGGDLERLLARARGVVTINSTVGLSAILAGCATCVLGQSIYNLPDLTHGQQLDSFWRNPHPPNAKFANHFAQYLRNFWHVPGAFDGPGSRVGAREIADWLCDIPASRESRLR